MMRAVITEFKKLLTVRSTYFVVGLAMLFVGFMAFYVEGVRGELLLDDPSLPFKIANLSFLITITTSQLMGILMILLVIHEYRYNLITYTLTSNRSRTQVFASKFIVAAVFTAVVTLMLIGFGITMYYLGLAVSGNTLPAQEFNIINILWRELFYTVGYTLLAVIIAFLVRNIAAALGLLFVGIGIAEQLLSLLLKSNSAYLPTTALQGVINFTNGPAEAGMRLLSYQKGAIVFLVYLVISGLITWYLFLKRDAN